MPWLKHRCHWVINTSVPSECNLTTPEGNLQSLGWGVGVERTHTRRTAPRKSSEKRFTKLTRRKTTAHKKHTFSLLCYQQENQSLVLKRKFYLNFRWEFEDVLWPLSASFSYNIASLPWMTWKDFAFNLSKERIDFCIFYSYCYILKLWPSCLETLGYQDLWLLFIRHFALAGFSFYLLILPLYPGTFHPFFICTFLPYLSPQRL